MTDLTANLYFKLFGKVQSVEKMILDNSSAQEVFEGAPLMIDIDVDGDYPVIFDSGVSLGSGDAFVGFATEYCNVLTSDNETDNEINVARPPGIIGFAMTGLTRANIGDLIYVSDSGTLTTSSSSAMQVGYIHDVTSTMVYIQLEYWQKT